MTAFADVVAVTEQVAATRKRTEKKAALAGLLRGLDTDEVEVVVGLITGEIRQGRIGIGWASIRDLDVSPAEHPTLTVEEVDRVLSELSTTTGPGSQAERARLLTDVFGRATRAEADYLGRIFVGEIRTGALAGIVTDAVAEASGVPLASVRRAVMLVGDLASIARLALEGGVEAVGKVGLVPGRGVQPMLASTSDSVAAAMARVGEASVEWKLDGIRIQVHKVDDDVRIFTRNLNDVTDRLHDVVARVGNFADDSFVLDGEVLGSTAAHFFDVLHIDGVDLIDEPLKERRRRLTALVGDALIPGVITTDPDEGQAVLDDALARGHEGVMVKAVDSPYEAGRRGKSWLKVKPVYVLDLVVIGVEWGSGRRRGWLSNIHLGARDPHSDDFVMVGKTFKGMTDEILRWQTERFAQLEVAREGHVVWLRPEQVVEIAVDGVHESTRYPGGVALRFARVKSYRSDKEAAEADTIDAVRALLPGGPPAV